MPLSPAQRELVEANLPAAQKMASVYLRNVPRHADRDGIRGAASLGLCKAAIKYDPARFANFADYAKPRIFGEMKDFSRRETMLTPHRSPRTVHPPRQAMPQRMRDRRENQFDQIERADEIRQAFRRLHGRSERLVMNAVAEGVEWPDIAGAVGVSVNMAFRIRANAMKRLRAA